MLSAWLFWSCSRTPSPLARTPLTTAWTSRPSSRFDSAIWAMMPTVEKEKLLGTCEFAVNS